MNSKWWFRFIVLIAVAGMSLAMVIPTVFDLKEESNFPVKRKISLGLDLQGGLYMILGIDFQKVYRDEVSLLLKKSQEYLKEEGIESKLGDVNLTDPDDPRRTLIVSDVSSVETAKEKLHEYYRQDVLRLTSENGGILEYGIHHVKRKAIEEESVTKSIEVIRNRIDEFGVTEPEITSQGNDRIVVQLPGVKDIERAKELIGKTAKLEFRMVNDEFGQGKLDEMVKKGETEKQLKYEKGKSLSKYIFDLNEFVKEELPKGYMIVFERTTNNLGETTMMTPVLVENDPPLTGEDLQDARVGTNPQTQEPIVNMTFKSRGATVFADLTDKNVGKRMAIVLDGNVYSAPVINERIGGGSAQITLGSGRNYNQIVKEASDLALVLRAGALPVQLDFEEQRIVGPQLGEDSIKSARTASVYGCLLVLFFILVYYRMSGFLAVTTLSLNILFILAALVSFEATLTLPGIAGIALTVGMAIDASIIIFERIREEVRSGKSNYVAVENGFGSAFWTILDANITTALAGFCLLNFGTGPVRGFAVTLLIGIVATVYTSYFVGSLLFQLYMNKTEGKNLSI